MFICESRFHSVINEQSNKELTNFILDKLMYNKDKFDASDTKYKQMHWNRAVEFMNILKTLSLKAESPFPSTYLAK